MTGPVALFVPVVGATKVAAVNFSKIIYHIFESREYFKAKLRRCKSNMHVIFNGWRMFKKKWRKPATKANWLSAPTSDLVFLGFCNIRSWLVEDDHTKLC